MSETKYYVRNNLLFSGISYAYKKYQIIYMYDVLGTGKTTAVEKWLAEKEYTCVRFDVSDKDTFMKWLLEQSFADRQIYFIDGLQQLAGDKAALELLGGKLAKAGAKAKFIITSRAKLPKQLKFFEVENRLTCIDKEEIRFGMAELREYLRLHQIELSDAELEISQERMSGSIKVLEYFCRCVKPGQEFSMDVLKKVGDDMFCYFDVELLSGYSDTLKHFLYRLALIDNITSGIMEYLYPNGEWKAYIEDTMATGSFLTQDTPDTYIMISAYRRFLYERGQEECAAEEFIFTNMKIAEYYEQKDDLTTALKYYYVADAHNKVRELLILNTKRNHKGVFYYYEMEPYYMMLSEEEIRQNPLLTGAMSMLYSLKGNRKKSEAYAELIDHQIKEVDKKSREYQELLEQKLYLIIALPHRGNVQMVKCIVTAAALIASGTMPVFPRMSVTGNMPSLMNGGKDFCTWSKHDEMLYTMLSTPVRQCLGDYARSTPELAIGESQLEKNHLSEAFAKISEGVTQADADNSMELFFAGQALIIRFLFIRGESEKGIEILRKLQDRLQKEQAVHLIPNFQAFEIRQLLNREYGVEMDRWLNRCEVDTISQFRTTDRLVLMTKARLMIAKEQYLEADVILNRMERYAKDYERIYIQLEVWILKAIIAYRQNRLEYEELLERVLKKTEGYHFIRVVADEGAAIWEILSNREPENAYQKELFEAVRKQAAFYPKYLQQKRNSAYNFTEAERNVMRLLVQGKKNDEIADILAISVNTVKYHLRNVYDKLGTKSRIAAIRLINEKGLV